MWVTPWPPYVHLLSSPQQHTHSLSLSLCQAHVGLVIKHKYFKLNYLNWTIYLFWFLFAFVLRVKFKVLVTFIYHPNSKHNISPSNMMLHTLRHTKLLPTLLSVYCKLTKSISTKVCAWNDLKIPNWNCLCCMPARTCREFRIYYRRFVHSMILCIALLFNRTCKK